MLLEFQFVNGIERRKDFYSGSAFAPWNCFELSEKRHGNQRVKMLRVSCIFVPARAAVASFAFAENSLVDFMAELISAICVTDTVSFSKTRAQF